MPVQPRTLILVGAGAALMAGLAYVTLRPEPVLVDLDTVITMPMQVTVNADGVTRIKDIYAVASPITGTAQRSPVHVGDRVTGGETIVAIVEPVAPALLDSRSRTQAEAALQEADAALHVAETDLARARESQALSQSQFNRTRTLVERDVASVTRLEDASQQLAVANATVEAALARIDMANGARASAQAALRTPQPSDGTDPGCCVALTAPVDGTVLEVFHESARPVVTGAPLVRIGDPTNLELVADLLSTDAVRLQPGAVAAVDRWGGDTQLTARLDHIAPSARTKVSALGIAEQRVDAVFDITSPLAARSTLGDGFSVFVRIIEWQTDAALTVPLAALFRRDNDWAVFVANGDAAEERIITLGRQNAQVAQVLSGLTAGETVIVHPNDSLQDGSYIATRPAGQE